MRPGQQSQPITGEDKQNLSHECNSKNHTMAWVGRYLICLVFLGPFRISRGSGGWTFVCFPPLRLQGVTKPSLGPCARVPNFLTWPGSSFSGQATIEQKVLPPAFGWFPRSRVFVHSLMLYARNGNKLPLAHTHQLSSRLWLSELLRRRNLNTITGPRLQQQKVLLQIRLLSNTVHSHFDALFPLVS